MGRGLASGAARYDLFDEQRETRGDIYAIHVDIFASRHIDDFIEDFP